MTEPRHCWDDIITDDIRRSYASYDRERRLGPRPALILIDFYKGMFEGGDRPVEDLLDTYPASCGQEAWRALPHAGRLLAAFRDAQLPVLFTTGRTGPAPSATLRKRAGRQPAHYEIAPELAPRDGEPVIVKDRASAFFGTSLIARLVSRGVRTVVMGGATTSGCLRASAVDAYSNGFAVCIAEECCFDRNPLSHKVNLFDLHAKYADVMRLDDIFSQMRSSRPKA